jgi:integrase
MATGGNAGYSANTIRTIRAVLRRALRQAEREGLVSRNAAALSAAPPVRSDEGRALSVDQGRALLEQVEGTREEPLLTVMLAFGLRRGEALGLRWSALDWDTATLKVTHAVKRVRDRAEPSALRPRLVIGELKTARSRRTLFLTPELVDLRRRHRARLAEERIAIGPGLAGIRLDLSERRGNATGPGQRIALVLSDLPAGRPRPLAPA